MSKEEQVKEWLNFKETVFIARDGNDKAQIAAAKKLGLIRQLGTGIYTGDLYTNIDNLITSNIWDIISLAFGVSIISRRSALFSGMTVDNSIEITEYNNKKSTSVGKLKIVTLKGPPPLEDDTLMAENIYIASPARFIVEFAIYLCENRRLPKTKRAQLISEVHDWMNKKYDPSMILQIEDLNIRSKVLLHEHFYNFCADISEVIDILGQLLNFKPTPKPTKLTEDDLKFL